MGVNGAKLNKRAPPKIRKTSIGRAIKDIAGQRRRDVVAQSGEHEIKKSQKGLAISYYC